MLWLLLIGLIIIKMLKVHHLVESTSDHCALLLTDATIVQKYPLNVDFNSKLYGQEGRNAKISSKGSGMAAKI